jgi:hypothetical protein
MKINSNQELLPPISHEPNTAADWSEWLTAPVPGRFMLPVTGLLIMGLDWLCFSEEAATLGLAIPLTSLVGFLAGAFGTYHLQRKYGLDSRPTAWLKSLLAGFLVGIPLPLGGTLLGAWILTQSGVMSLKDRLWKERFGRKQQRS